MYNISRARFEYAFPIFSRLVNNPVFVIVFGFIAAFGLAFLSPHYSLSVAVLVVAILLFKLDAPMSTRLILSPMSLLVAQHVLINAIGVTFYIFGTGGGYRYGLLCAQIGSIVFMLFAFFGYRMCIPASKDIHLPFEDNRFICKTLRPVADLCFFMLCYTCIGFYLSILSGGRDRGYAGEGVEFAQLYWWSVFQIFHRFKGIALVAVPLILRHANPMYRIFVIPMVGLYLLLGLANGDRGLVLWGIVSIVFGFFLFLKRFRFRIEVVAIASFPLVLVFLFVVDAFRNTDEFYESKGADLFDRLSAFSQVADSIATDEARLNLEGVGQNFYEKVGSRIIGNYDSLMFEMTPSVFPFWGFHDFYGMVYVWIPYSLYKDRPMLADGNNVASLYRNVYNVRSRAGISMVGDLYRRFGWIGFPIGAFVFGIFYGLYWKLVFWIYERKSSFLGLFALFLMFTLLFGKSYTTILSSWWLFVYDMPKHIIMIYVYWFFFIRGKYERSATLLQSRTVTQ